MADLQISDGDPSYEFGKASRKPHLALSGALPHVDMNVFLPGKGRQLAQAFLAAEPRLFDASERRAQEVASDLVDPDIARVDCHGGPVRGAEIIRPDGAGEPIFGTVDLGEHRRF